MEYIFNNLDIENIIYSYAKENYKSKKLSDRLGFEFLYEYTEHYSRIDKDIEEIKEVMSKKRFKKLYGVRKS